MTPRQAQTLRAIERSIHERGYAPSYPELQAELGMAGKSGIHRMLTELEAQGRIIRRHGRERGIELVPRLDALSLLDQITTEALRAELARREAVA